MTKVLASSETLQFWFESIKKAAEFFETTDKEIVKAIRRGTTITGANGQQFTFDVEE